MHAISKLAPIILVGGAALLTACQSVAVDTSGGGVPPAGVIRGAVNYIGPPPCSQNGHVVGNAVLLVFDARNPPPPAGLGATAVNFGVVPGDTLFRDWPVTAGATKVCPDPSSPVQTVSAPFAISPMDPGAYVIQAFFDYTGNFFATFKFRQLPEATDVGGGYLDLIDAQKLVPIATTTDAGTTVSTYVEQQANPNYLPHFLPVGIGTPGPTPSTSLWGVPTFTMPNTGYLADNVTVTIAARLGLSRPYFYPTGVTQAQPPIAPAVFSVNDESDVIPAAPVKTPANPSGNVNFVPVLSFPQDVQIYAQPSTLGAGKPGVLDQFQGALPMLQLVAGVPSAEQPAAAESVLPAYPFHMQLGIANAPPSYAPGGNGGIFVWWNANHTTEDCGGDPTCTADPQADLDFIVESPGKVFRMWPLVVLAKLQDLPPPQGTPQPNPNDIDALIAQGTDLKQPVVIIQGITLFKDTVVSTVNQQLAGGVGYQPLTYPDLAGKTNLEPHVSVLVRPSTLCLDPRAPDNGGVLVATGQITNGQILGTFPPADTKETIPPVVIDSQNLSNPQLAKLINHRLGSNGLLGGCLPTGRYQINLVYPTGQAWTTPNETGSCASAEGLSVLTSNPGTCKIKPRPVLRSQGTRAVVEITAAADPNNCKAGATVPPVPFACTSLCPDPNLDPTTTPPCGTCLDKTLDPKSSPPCSAGLAGH
jgi:hypothetical protein